MVRTPKAAVGLLHSAGDQNNFVVAAAIAPYEELNADSFSLHNRLNSLRSAADGEALDKVIWVIQCATTVGTASASPVALLKKSRVLGLERS